MKEYPDPTFCNCDICREMDAKYKKLKEEKEKKKDKQTKEVKGDN